MKSFTVNYLPFLFLILVFQQCRERHRDPSSIELQIGDLYEKAADHYYNKEYDEALSYAFEHKRISEAENFQKGLGAACHLLGTIHKSKNEHIPALRYYLQAMLIREELADSISLAKTYNNIANLYSENGFHDKSLEYHSKSIKIYENTDNLNLLDEAYKNIGYAYREKGNYEEALRYFFKSLVIRQKLGDNKKTGYCYNDIALTYRQNEAYNDAIAYYQKALGIWEKLNQGRRIAGVYSNITVMYYYLAEYNKAIATAVIANNLSDKNNIETGKVYTYNTLSAIYLERNTIDSALYYANRAIDIAEKHDIRDERQKAYGYAAKAYITLDAYKEATQCLKMTNHIKDSIIHQRDEIIEITIGRTISLEDVEDEYMMARTAAIHTNEMNRQMILIALTGTGLFTLMYIGLIAQERNYFQRLVGNVPQARIYLPPLLWALFRVYRWQEWVKQVAQRKTQPEIFNPSAHIEVILDRYEKQATTRGVMICSSIKNEHFIETNKQVYLKAFEKMLRQALQWATIGTILEVNIQEIFTNVTLDIRIHHKTKISRKQMDRSPVEEIKAIGGEASIFNSPDGRVGFILIFPMLR